MKAYTNVYFKRFFSTTKWILDVNEYIDVCKRKQLIKKL